MSGDHEREQLAERPIDLLRQECAGARVIDPASPRSVGLAFSLDVGVAAMIRASGRGANVLLKISRVLPEVVQQICDLAERSSTPLGSERTRESADLLQ